MSNAPATEFVTYSVHDSIATITFNRPEKLNALLPSMIHSYSDLLSFADKDPDVRAIVVTGAGRGFCSGADLSLLGQDGEAIKGFLQGQSHETVPGKFLHLRTPVITAINGPATGLGFVIAISADIRIVHNAARLSTTFSGLGLVAEYGVAWLLPRIVGLGIATDLLLSARTITGDQARELGLVHYSTDDPLSEAYSYARGLIERNSPSSIAIIKEQLLRSQLETFDESADSAFSYMAQGFTWPDLLIALQAKLAGEKPAFPPVTGN